jgi:HSP20 family protein
VDKDKDHKAGLEGLFRGIASILHMANDIAVRAGDDGSTPIEVARTATMGVPGAVNVAYGGSMRIGARGAPPRARAMQEPAADVFDEGDHYVVIAELPGIEASAIGWTVTAGRHLVIRAESTERKYVKDVQFPTLVSDQAVTSCYANGVLELRLWKA